MRIGAREMADQHSHRAGSAVEHKWKVRGKEPVGCRTCHQRREWMRFEEGVQCWKVVLGEGTRDVHGDGR